MTTWLVSLNLSQKKRMKKRVRMRSKRAVKKKVKMDLLKMRTAPMIQRTQNKLAKRKIRAHQKALILLKPRNQQQSPIKRVI